MASKEETLIKQAKQMNVPIPDRILNKPVLAQELNLYYEAFFDLQYDRNANEKIPWSVIVKYSDRYNFDQEQEELLIRYIRILDKAFHDWSTKGSRDNGKP